MTLTEELKVVVLSFVRSESTLDDLQDWLASHVQAAADDPDQTARELAADAWILLDEYSRRVLTREALQRELAELASLPSAESVGTG